MFTAPPTRRRWFHFGLGTAFIMVTLFAVWLEWEMRFIRKRQAALKAIAGHPGSVAFRLSDYDPISLKRDWPDPGTRPKAIPFWRKWLGDETVVGVGLMDGNAAYADRIRHLFPEVPEEEVRLMGNQHLIPSPYSSALEPLYMPPLDTEAHE